MKKKNFAKTVIILLLLCVHHCWLKLSRTIHRCIVKTESKISFWSTVGDEIPKEWEWQRSEWGRSA
jgi:hypothetical protein